MSGYDAATGWTHFTPTKLNRYVRHIAGWTDDLDERFEQSDVEHYWDHTGGIHAHCGEDRLWELLSGQPNSRPHRDLPTPSAAEFISVTDLGAVVWPPLPTSTVLKALRQEGLLTRVDGHELPTPAAAGLYEEREAEETSRFEHRTGSVQRRWSYEVLLRLRDRSDELEAMRPVSKPKRTSRAITLRYASNCSNCSKCRRSLEVGTEAWWEPGTKATVWCLGCDDVTA